jgi:rSAM/selenodomain-associated transferase 1
MESSSQIVERLSKRDRTLVIMAKAPRPGMVKTRLTPSLPLPAITAFYRCLLYDTLTLARSLGDTEIAVMCPAPDVDELASLVGKGVDVLAQKGEGLAAGLTSVFAQFAAAGRQHVVAFNSDSPHLPAPVLESAFETLVAFDVVVGPTHDGGYYLVGAKASHPNLFDGDGLGTKSALDALLAHAHSLQLSVGFTEPFYDIDVAADLTRLAAELRLAPARAPQTASWLEQWGQVVAQLPRGAGDL